MENKAMNQRKKADKIFTGRQLYRLTELFLIDPDGIFCKTLRERILANNFTEEILVKTIDYVIDHVEPNFLSIASVMKAKQAVEEYEANKIRLYPAFGTGD
ncbi:MAG: hypothetical protein LBL57_04105 [Tannerella sp.]|jgi:hypothetical protein|nr:hypothetical protein [Tannerella sp.]